APALERRGHDGQQHDRLLVVEVVPDDDADLRSEREIDGERLVAPLIDLGPPFYPAVPARAGEAQGHAGGVRLEQPRHPALAARGEERGIEIAPRSPELE